MNKSIKSLTSSLFFEIKNNNINRVLSLLNNPDFHLTKSEYKDLVIDKLPELVTIDNQQCLILVRDYYSFAVFYGIELNEVSRLLGKIHYREIVSYPEDINPSHIFKVFSRQMKSIENVEYVGTLYDKPIIVHIIGVFENNMFLGGGLDFDYNEELTSHEQKKIRKVIRKIEEEYSPKTPYIEILR